MDNEVKSDNELVKVSEKQRWFAGYIVAGLIWVMAQGFNKTPYDGIIILVIAVLCGYFYHKAKNSMRIKNKFLKIILTFLALELIAGFCIGILTALI